MQPLNVEPQPINNQAEIIVCHECDLTVELPELAHRQKALCPRCGYKLTQFNLQATQQILALSSAAFMFLLLSLPFDFLGFSAQGNEQNINIPLGLAVLVEQHYLPLAIIQFVTIILLPAIILCSVFYVVFGISLNKRFAGSETLVNLVFKIVPWSMPEVYLIGVLVSLVKIMSLADVTMGMSFFAYIAFTICLTMVLSRLDRHQLNKQLKIIEHHLTPVEASENIQTTWALLLTSVILYIPANTLPIMDTQLLGGSEPATIMGGVIVLWDMGSYPIALVIFFASVFVPVGKLILMMWLNYSVQKGINTGYDERIKWYRIVEFIGRWSMIDVYVVTVLVSLVQLGTIMRILPGPASLAFFAVVVLTMLAAMNFDTRLIWKNAKKQ